MRAVLLAFALALPAHAQAPMIASELDCGSLVGKGSVRLLLGGEIKATIEITCGVRPV